MYRKLNSNLTISFRFGRKTGKSPTAFWSFLSVTDVHGKKLKKRELAVTRCYWQAQEEAQIELTNSFCYLPEWEEEQQMWDDCYILLLTWKERCSTVNQLLLSVMDINRKTHNSKLTICFYCWHKQEEGQQWTDQSFPLLTWMGRSSKLTISVTSMKAFNISHMKSQQWTDLLPFCY